MLALADGDGTTALHRASYQDDLAQADALIRSGADVNAATDLGVTPLWLAAQNGSEKMVARLLSAGANSNAALLAGETPVMVAARSGKPPSSDADREERKRSAPAACDQHHVGRHRKHPDVVKVLLAPQRRRIAPLERWSQLMAVPPPGTPSRRRFRRRETALLVPRAPAISTRPAPPRRRRQRQRRRRVSVTPSPAALGFEDVVDFLLERGAVSAVKGFAPSPKRSCSATKP
jgi:hypothetical protein